MLLYLYNLSVSNKLETIGSNSSCECEHNITKILRFNKASYTIPNNNKLSLKSTQSASDVISEIHMPLVTNKI